MPKRYYWLKLNKDFFDSVRIRKLRSIAGGDTFTIIYLKLLLHAIDTDGILEYQGIEKSISEELALVLSEDAENVGLCLNYLRSVGLAEVRSESIMLPEAIEKVGSETASTQRVRDFRNRQKEAKALHCNTDVTNCNADVTQMKRLCNVEIEKEIETDKEKIREEKKEGITNVIPKKENPSSRFIPPTVEEVQTYISENMYTIDAQKFVDYYTSNGWIVGKTKMKDWKATVRGWERREQEKFAKEQRQPKGGFRFDQL